MNLLVVDVAEQLQLRRFLSTSTQPLVPSQKLSLWKDESSSLTCSYSRRTSQSSRNARSARGTGGRLSWRLELAVAETDPLYVVSRFSIWRHPVAKPSYCAFASVITRQHQIYAIVEFC